jgi:hypothetical protein
MYNLLDINTAWILLIFSLIVIAHLQKYYELLFNWIENELARQKWYKNEERK